MKRKITKQIVDFFASSPPLNEILATALDKSIQMVCACGNNGTVLRGKKCVDGGSGVDRVRLDGWH